MGYRTKNQFARALKRQMEAKSMSISQLAEKSDITIGYLSLILSGQRNPPTPDKIDKLTRALGLKPPMLHLLAGYIPRTDPQWRRFFDRLQFMDNDEIDKLMAYVNGLPKRRKQ